MWKPEKLKTAFEAGYFSDLANWMQRHAVVDPHYGQIAALISNFRVGGSESAMRNALRGIADRVSAVVAERGGLKDAIASQSSVRTFAEDLPIAYELFALRNGGPPR